MIYLVLGNMIGKEIVQVNATSFSIARKVLGVEKPKTYDGNYVKDLRVAPYSFQSSWPGASFRPPWMRGTTMLAFDYGAKTIRFGNMEEAEAKMVLAEILRRYPTCGK